MILQENCNYFGNIAHMGPKRSLRSDICLVCIAARAYDTQQNLILNCRLRFLLILWPDILDGMLYYVISGWSGLHDLGQWELGIQPLWPIRSHRDHWSPPAGCQAVLLLVIMRRKQEKTRWPREIYTARYKRDIDCYFVWPGRGENDENWTFLEYLCDTILNV